MFFSFKSRGLNYELAKRDLINPLRFWNISYVKAINKVEDQEIKALLLKKYKHRIILYVCCTVFIAIIFLLKINT